MWTYLDLTHRVGVFLSAILSSPVWVGHALYCLPSSRLPPLHLQKILTCPNPEKNVKFILTEISTCTKMVIVSNNEDIKFKPSHQCWHTNQQRNIPNDSNFRLPVAVVGWIFVSKLMRYVYMVHIYYYLHFLMFIHAPIYVWMGWILFFQEL